MNQELILAIIAVIILLLAIIISAGLYFNYINHL